jgi:S-adenosyl-L-methionine hydrolase (adenosine-forming)
LSTPPHPVLLLTDFGLDDTYVGQIKAVILGLTPGCPLVDLTHAVPPQDVAAGARALTQCLPTLPRPAVVLAVVDPGVGTTRRGLIVRADGRIYVAPDNGLLTPVLRADARATVIALDPGRVTTGPVSRTFHGRDLFAPAVARLAAGEAPTALGDVVTDPVLLPAPTHPTRTATGWLGRVVAVDRFGNLITDLDAHHLTGSATAVRLAEPATVVPLVSTYADVEPGQLAALLGSDGFLELACNGGSAAVMTGLSIGDELELVCE